MQVFTYSGAVVELGSRRGIAKLRVELWDLDHVCHDLVEAAFTDAGGAFRVALDASRVDELFLGRSAVAYFKVFHDATIVADTHAHLTWSIRGGDGSGRIEIPRSMAAIGKDQPAPWIVRGRVLNARTGPVDGATVRAAHKALRTETELGHATTDAQGTYQISYDADVLVRLGEPRADLAVTALDASGAVLAEAPIVFQAPATAQVDVLVGGQSYLGPAEADTLQAVVARAAAGARPSALSAADQAFLASARSLDPVALRTLVAADQLAGDSAGTVAPLYAVGRGGVPLTIPGLLRASPGSLRSALDAAVATNRIAIPPGKTLDDVHAQVNAAVVRAALVKSPDGLVATAGDVLSTVVSDPAGQGEILTRYLNRTSTDDFWAGLEGLPATTNTVGAALASGVAAFSSSGGVGALQLAFDVADVSGMHLPLIQALVVGKAAGPLSTVRDLARLDVSDWTAILNQPHGGAVIGAPASTPGATLADKIAHYAGNLASTLAARFPTPAIAGRLTKLNRPADADVIKFLAQNPDFEFASNRVAAYLATNQKATAGLREPAAAVRSLQARERVFKLTRTFEHHDALLQAGIDSARAVEALGPAAFHAQFDAKIGPAAAQAIVNNACFVTAAVETLHARHSAKLNATPVRALPALALLQNPIFNPPTGGSPPPDQPSPVYLPPEMADWPTLFGVVDQCACDECSSVYGPAAYLVDVLDFLAGVPSDMGNYTARDLLIGTSASTEGFQLVGRRPDIGHILLNCDNADTPVPYIDLLNEILEYKVAAVVGHAVAFADRAATTGDAADLSASRQVLSDELPAYTIAYETLAAAAYPWSLPFDRAAEEATAHLVMLGVQAPVLMQTFTPPALAADEAAAELAAVSLGLLPRDRGIIEGKPIGGGPASPGSDWGLTSTGNWQTQLLAVGTFLDAAGMAYADLLELLDASLLAPFLSAGASAPTISLIQPLPAGSDCDPMNLTISGLDPAKVTDLWPLVHRFLRLRSKLGVTTTELDKVLAQFTPAGQAATIGDAMLERLSVIMTVRAELGTPIVEMLSWWGPIDRRPSPLSKQPSLFAQRFLNPALATATDDEALFKKLLDPGLLPGSAPPDPSDPSSQPKLAEHAARVAAGSQLSGSDYALLTDPATSTGVLGLASELDATALLTLDNVSLVFRVASLARALKLSVGDLLQLRALSGIDPFDAADLRQLTVYIETAKQVQGAGFTVAELAYILRQLAPSASAFSLIPAQVASFLADLAPALQKIVSDTTFTVVSTTGDPAIDDPTGALTTKALGAILPAELPPGAQGTDVATALQALQAKTPTPTDIQTTFSFLGSGPAAQLAADITAGTPLAQRYGYAAPQLLLYQRRTQAIALVERKLAAALKLDPSIVSGLCEQWLTSSRGGSTPPSAIEDFLPRATPDGTGATPADSDLTLWRTTTYIRLQKVATLVQKLRIGPKELPTLLPAPTGQGFIDLNLLPAPVGVVVAPSTALFGSLQRVIRACAVRARLRGGPTALFDLIAQAVAAGPPSEPPPSAFLASLSQATGWSSTDLLALTTFYGMTLADFQKETGYITLANAFDVLARLGTSAASAIAWAGSFFVAIDPTLPNYSASTYPAETATEIKKAAKGKVDDAAWLTAEKPVSDQLRDAQRAALVAYLIGNTTYVPGGSTVPVQRYRTDNDLFDDLLVDVDTSPSVMTSRLKLAMGSAQLFVQRCLLGLEQVTLKQEDAENWSWMRRYRVWEANRQIFLYPENWIVPELRDDKTELFKKLETALSKQAVTADTVADAFNTYLEGFLELSNIEVVATYFQKSGDEYDDDVVHVIGRTRGTPQDYYYRRRIGLQYWTGWEKVTASIDGTVLLPVVFERRFFLFWPMMKVANDPKVDNTVPKAGTQIDSPPQHVEIQFAWIERKHAQWTGKKVAEGTIILEELSWPQWLNHEGFLSTDASLLFDTVVDEDAGLLHVRVGAAVSSSARFVFVGEATWNVCGETATSANYDSPTDVYAPARPSEALPIDNQPEWKEHFSLGSLTIDESTADLQPDAPQGSTTVILQHTVIPFALVFSRQAQEPGEGAAGFGSAYPFFLKDSTATFFVEEKEVWHLTHLPKTGHLFAWPTIAYRFLPHYQPYVCTFIEKLNRYGFTGSHRWSTQVVELQSPPSTLLFEGTNPPYVPSTNVIKPYPVADVDFSFGGAYSVYNWETFFHIPLLIATRLSQNQQFEDAHRWFLTIFDPTAPGSGTIPGRYWKVRPFRENADFSTLAQDIASSKPTLPPAQLVNALLNQEDEPLTWDFQSQVEAWRRDPFNPHLIARTRPIAYQKTVLMRFLDNLIAWGDSLFRQDTIESINEATQLYILAAEVLGPRPKLLQAPDPPAPTTYWGLAKAGLDVFGDALVQTESLVSTPPDTLISCPYGPNAPTLTGTLYFCVPQNPQLLAYWDTVADRLFKIRHSMNIQGVVQQLPLFEPPIDPGLLVAAAAAGVDIDQVLDSVNGPNPVYRFAALMPKALEVAAGVAQLGASLLSTLEKSDSEGLATLRSGQELALLQLVRDVKQRQVDEAQANVDALTQAEAVVVAKQTYYHSRVLVSPGEAMALGASAAATLLQVTSQAIVAGGGTAQAFPTSYTGVVGPLPTELVAEGGLNIGEGLKTAGEALGIEATVLHEEASVMATLAGYQRRMDDWQFQGGLADIELQQVKQQLVAAQIRLDIATKELANHDQQIANAQAVDDYLRGKFTNQALYDWMSGQIATTYFQSYQRAFEVAKRAERAYQLELALPNASFVNPGNWDNLRQGLLAGEKLLHDLRRMELSYLDENVRELEITKHVSLAQRFPDMLYTLVTSGTATVNLSETLFDLDYPGHYLRRLRTVSLTLPNVSGPYTSVNCTLKQTASYIRRDTVTSPYQPQNGPGTLLPPVPTIQQIVTSGGVGDAGLFEVNFHDERYLPFEGTGAVSTFQVDLPLETNPFDVGTLEDVVLHLKYTSRDGGVAFRESAVKPSLPNPAKGTWLLRVAKDRATAWRAFTNVAQGASPTLSLDLEQDQFPYLPGGGTVNITSLQLVAQGPGFQGQSPAKVTFTVTPPGGTGVTIDVTAPSWATLGGSSPLPSPLGTWTFTLPPGTDLSGLSELWIRVSYTMVP